MPTTCVRCHAADGAHYPWCTMASLFERLLGSPGQVAGEPPPQAAEPPDPGEVSDLRETVEELRAHLGEVTDSLVQERRLRADAEAALAEMRERAAARSKAPAADGDEVMRLRTKLTAAEENARKALDARTLALQQRDRAREDRDAHVREMENARREKTELERQLTRAVEERNRIAEERNRLEALVGTRGPQPRAERNRAAVTADQSRRTAEAQADRALDEAIKGVEAAGGTVVVEPAKPEAPKAEAPKPAPPAPQPVQGEPPKSYEKYAPGSEAAERSKEAADLYAAAELFVGEHVEKAPGSRVKAPDLLSAFEAWLPSIGFQRKWTTAASAARQVGQAMGKQGFGKRQIADPETGSAPINYLGARLKGAREAESKEGNHPGTNGIAAPPGSDPLAAIAAMRAAAQEAKRPPSAAKGSGSTGYSLKGVSPGGELKSREVRDMAKTLVSQQGWVYEPRKGRQAHPVLVSPEGQRYTLTTGSSRSSAVKTRADLRRMGARLP